MLYKQEKLCKKKYTKKSESSSSEESFQKIYYKKKKKYSSSDSNSESSTKTKCKKNYKGEKGEIQYIKQANLNFKQKSGLLKTAIDALRAKLALIK